MLLGGSAPRTAQPGDVILAQFVAYVAGYEDRARQVLEREPDAGEIRLGEQTDCRWAVGARVIVRCRARGLVVPTPVQGFRWNGECRSVTFDIEVPPDAKPRDAAIVFEAFVQEDADDAPDPVEVGRLSIPLDITLQEQEAQVQPPPPQRVVAQAARTAFASYASEDRVDVLERVSSIRRSAGMEVWMDIVDLRMGDKWEPALRENIARSDRFLLFWSNHAAQSDWVGREWRQAVAMKGEEILELHLLRHTPIDDVPEPLRKFHFNDIYLLARDAELYRRSRVDDTPDA
ncbi:MAG TPA: toll/interleukin-1 receptor domain-containing protein [Longimicrobium sp.]|nr:toll/interleukin-1 receptor domain-containing protein [Longimicrobium sp.]